MLKKSALAFMLAATSALGLSGCAQEIDTVQSATGETHSLSTLKEIPASSFVSFGSDSVDLSRGVDNVADCFKAASWMLSKNPQGASSGACQDKDGNAIAMIGKKADGAVYLIAMQPKLK